MGEKNEVTTVDQSDNLTVMAKCVSEQDWQKCELDCPREETHVCYGLFAPLVPTTCFQLQPVPCFPPDNLLPPPCHSYTWLIPETTPHPGL